MSFRFVRNIIATMLCVAIAVLIYAFVALAGVSLPYQDAPEAMLRQQAIQITNAESLLRWSALLVGGLALAWLVARRRFLASIRA